jgi:hypothetical protein
MIIVEVQRHTVCSQLSRDLKRCVVRYDLGVGDSRLNVSESNIFETSFKGQVIMYRLQWEERLSSRNSSINALRKTQKQQLCEHGIMMFLQILWFDLKGRC